MQSIRHVGRLARDFVASTVAPAVSSSEWRRRRLLILGYHGVSLHDEHLWDGRIYMAPQQFRERLRILQQGRYTVLTLSSALLHLRAGTLPPRSIVLAFDDGFQDFYSVTAPILSEFGYPATIFVSSYYARFNRPVFDIMLRYLLWKTAAESLLLPDVSRRPFKLKRHGEANVLKHVHEFTFRMQMTGRDKDVLLSDIASRLGVDYEALCERRLLHMMNGEEVRHMHELGHEIQLHTHRHRVSHKRELFAREIRENQLWIQKTIGHRPAHLSFPGGVWQPIKRQWLLELGIESATTCKPGLAHAGSDELRLPRFVDHSLVPENAFRSWIAGSMEFFPKGTDPSTVGQILEETVHQTASTTAPASTAAERAKAFEYYY